MLEEKDDTAPQERNAGGAKAGTINGRSVGSARTSVTFSSKPHGTCSAGIGSFSGSDLGTNDIMFVTSKKQILYLP